MDLSNAANTFASVASFLYIWHQLGLAKLWAQSNVGQEGIQRFGGEAF